MAVKKGSVAKRGKRTFKKALPGVNDGDGGSDIYENPTKPVGVGAYGRSAQNAAKNQQHQINQDVARQQQVANARKFASQSARQQKIDQDKASSQEQAAAERKTTQDAVVAENKGARAAQIAGKKQEEGKDIGQSAEERQSSDEERDVDSIQQESVDGREVVAQKKKEEEDKLASEKAAKEQAALEEQRAQERAGISAEKQKQWDEYEKRDKNLTRALTGLRLFGDMLDTAVKAFGAIMKLPKKILMSNVISDPMGPAKQMLATTIVDAGAMMQEVTDNIGHVWGIKDGVKDPKDIAGTYKGAQYYKDHADMETVHAIFANDLGNITQDVFGKNEKYKEFMDENGRMDASRFGDMLLKAIDEKDYESLGKIQKVFHDQMNSERGKRAQMNMNRELREKYDDNIPKDQKYKAPAGDRAFYNLYNRYQRGLTNAFEHIRAQYAREAGYARNEAQNIREEISWMNKEEKERVRAEKDPRNIIQFYRDKNHPQATQIANALQYLVGYDGRFLGKPELTYLEADGMIPLTDQQARKILEKINAKGDQASDEDKALADLINKRFEARKPSEEEPEQPPLTDDGSLPPFEVPPEDIPDDEPPEAVNDFGVYDKPAQNWKRHNDAQNEIDYIRDRIYSALINDGRLNKDVSFEDAGDIINRILLGNKGTYAKYKELVKDRNMFGAARRFQQKDDVHAKKLTQAANVMAANEGITVEEAERRINVLRDRALRIRRQMFEESKGNYSVDSMERMRREFDEAVKEWEDALNTKPRAAEASETGGSDDEEGEDEFSDDEGDDVIVI